MHIYAVGGPSVILDIQFAELIDLNPRKADIRAGRSIPQTSYRYVELSRFYESV